VSSPAPFRQRWATLVVAVAIVVALLSATTASFLQARHAAAQLERTYGNRMANAASRALRQSGGGTSLADIHADESADGLVAIGLVRDGRLLERAGQADLDGLVGLRPDEPVRVDEGVALLTRPRRGRRARKGPPGPQVLLVYRDPIADSLRSGATRTLAFGWFAGIALLGLAGVVWRKSVAEEAAAIERERERHLASLGELSAVLGHEIRNPLASLKGHAQLLERRVRDDEGLHRKASLVVSEAERLERLTTRILAFARMAEPNTSLQDPAAILSALAERLGEPRLRVEVGALPRWSLDPDWFPQAIENLVRNGLEASADGEVIVSASMDGSALRVEVRDHGPGFAPEQRARIFEPFHTSKTRGTGLGLAIARRVVEQHNGRIEALDAPRGGALVRITLEPRP